MTAFAAEIKRGRKYDQVVDGAREIFMRDGFEGASVDDIARAAGVSKATLYSYFPDKRLLFSEVARIECNRQAEEAIALIGVHETIENVLHEAAHILVRFYLSDFGKQVYRICVAEADRFPELGQSFYQSGPMLARQRLSAVLAPFVEKGDLVISDMNLATGQFTELCKSELFVRALCGVQKQFTDAEIARVAEGAVLMFLARYRKRV
ncbi:MAG: TetR/AcrR family transcriptional regulator [Pseudomonadota bacterium]